MTLMQLAGVTMLVLGGLMSSSVASHELAWRKGESRQVGFGNCSKGSCTKRTCRAPTRPHRHVGTAVIIDRTGSPECWRGAERRLR